MLIDNSNAKRLAIFFFYDRRGIVDSYVPYLLEDLKKNVSEIFVVCNGKLKEEGKRELEKYGKVLVRENKGFDVWAYKTALETYGWKKLEEFDEVIKPCEIRLLREAKDENHFVMLHMCKDHLDLTRYADYPCDAVNWGIYSDNISLEEGRKLFAGKTILGGLDDRDGVLVHGTKEQIERRVAELMDEMKGYPFILGADCTLPTDIPYDNIRAAIEATRKHAR